MPFWDGLTEKLKKTAKPTQSQGLRGRLDEEMGRLRSEEEEAEKKRSRQQKSVEEQARQEDARILGVLLNWKLDVSAQPTQTPAKVDGLWFGSERYLAKNAETGDDEIGWKLYLFRPCPHCKHLIRTIELGEYSEVLAAVKRETSGLEPNMEKSTGKLATYLRDVETGKLDPLWPRVCPACKKPLKGSGAPL